MAKMNMTSLDVLTDEVFGKIGTPKRNAMEKQLKEEVNAYFVGEAIRKMRQAQNLTQEELGERVGVQKAQISRLEKGKSVITLPTMSRIFQALGVATATLDLGIGGKVALWSTRKKAAGWAFAQQPLSSERGETLVVVTPFHQLCLSDSGQ